MWTLSSATVSSCLPHPHCRISGDFGPDGDFLSFGPHFLYFRLENALKDKLRCRWQQWPMSHNVPLNSCNVSDTIIQLLFNSQEMVEDSPLDLIWSKLTFITHHNRETTLYKGRQFTELPIQEYTFSVGPIRSGIPDLVRIRTKVAKMVRNWVPWSDLFWDAPVTTE